MIGSLMYLTATRPDLMYSVGLASRYMERPTEAHLMAIKRILRYVKGTINFGIVFQRQKCSNSNTCKLVGYTDSDYSGDSNDRKSTTGYVFVIRSGAVISWCSRKQPVVSLSTTEA